ncbi:hypothetical protein SCHPADRAFT_898512 [Schizopora paradoxa]|uniref:F-box domain-containing protein n=1 Tax=Schizopora paradoxa TaxID=27342 RepID=A0A0H2S6Q3_9AGAM|nr:hypothetical protein SCHPADRAFT_898512 [Schizopora paradoxa]
MKAQDTPWPYMLVCKAWYQILSSTPSLWTTFFVICDGRYSNIPHIPAMFDFYLRHSEDLPLTLYISVLFTTIKEDDTMSHVLFIDLLSRAYEVQHRWEDVHLCLECYAYHERVITGKTRHPNDLLLDINSMPALKKLSIDMPEDLPSHFRNCNVLALAHSDRLQYLRLRNVQVLFPTTSTRPVPIYLPNLHTLQLDSLREGTYDHIWALLSASSNVVSLKLDVTFLPEVEVEPTQPSTMSLFSLLKLERLSIRSCSFKQLLSFMDLIDFPSLRNLELLNFNLDNESLIGMARLFCRHPHSIVSLLVDVTSLDEHLSDSALEEFLGSFSELEHLKLDVAHCCTTPESLYRAFSAVLTRQRTAGQNRPLILSRLKALDLAGNVSLHKVGIPSAVKGVIMACKERYPAEFCISVKQDTLILAALRYEDIKAILVRPLLDDMEIRRCVTETFSVTIESEKVVCVMD